MNRRDFLKNAGLAAGSAFAMQGLSSGAPLVPETTHNFKTKHLIWIINGNGSRKMDWYENPDLSPNYARLAKEAFVYTNSHNDTVVSHTCAWKELITGRQDQYLRRTCPTPLHYVRAAYGDAASNYWLLNSVNHYRQWRYNSRYLVEKGTGPVSVTATNIYSPALHRTPPNILTEDFVGAGLTPREEKKMEEFIDATMKAKLWEFNLHHAPVPRDPFISDAVGLALIPHIMKEFKPRILIFHQVGHDGAHGNGAFWRPEVRNREYEKICRTTDEQIGRIFDFVKNDPYFSKNTAIVVRPDFGRDDEVNMYGELHHTAGYHQTDRSAEIWYGPDFKTGRSERLTNRMDVVPSITRLFNVDAPYANGQAHTEMFKGPLG